MVEKKNQTESLQKRIAELERQLAEAQAVIRALESNREDQDHSSSQRESGNILFSSEAGFRQALLLAPYPLMIWREDGKVIMLNTTFTAISGYTLEDIPTFEEWMRKALGSRVLEQPSLIFYEEYPGQDVKKSREFEITTRTGEKRIWDFSYAVLGTDQGDRWLMIAMAVDITERVDVEEQLLENEHKFSIIFDKAPFAAALSRLPTGAITHINEEFERVFGYSRQEVLGKTSLEVGINPDAESRARILAEIQSQGSARDVETRLKTKSGEVRTFLLNLDQVAIEGEKYVLQTAQDITEQKRAEESLQEMARLVDQDRTRLNAVLEHLPIGVWISDSEGRLIRKNEQADRIWAGKAPLLQTIDEYSQYQSWDTRSGLLLQAEEYPMVVALRTGQPVEPVELRIRRFDGSEGFVLVSAVPIKDEQGLVTEVVAVNVDITERKRAEQALQESELKYSQLFGKSAIPAVLLQLPETIIVDANEALEKLVGFTQQEMYGKTAVKLGIASPKTREQSIEKFDRQGSLYGHETQIFTKTGEERIVSIATNQLEFGGRRYAISTMQDITERKRAEEALRNSEERFSKAFHKSPFGMNITRWRDGTILDVNEAWLKLLGWTREEVIGKTTAGFPFYARPEDRQWVRERITKDEVPGDMELHLVRKDGYELVVIVATTIIELQGERCILGVLNDITERKRAELALQESEQRYRGLFEQMQEGLVAAEVITDDHGKPVNYRYLDVNPATERQFGIPREQFIGRTYTEVLPDGDQEWIKILGQVALTGEPASVERFGLASRKWFEAHAYSPRPGQFINILTDITKRKQAEEALRQSEERFSKAFHSSPDAIIISRITDGLIIEVNEGWRELFGHDPADVLGHTSIELNLFANPEDRKEAIRRIQEQGLVRNFELEIRKKSGEIRLASLSAEKIELNGEAALLTVLRDITERKQAEEQIVYQAKLLASVNDAIVGSDAEYRLTAWNVAAETIYGWKAEEVMGRNGLEILQTQWPQEQAEEMRRRIAESGRWRGEATQLRKDGTRIPVEVSSIVLRNEQGEVTGYVSVNRDITERKKVERALEASEAKMRAVFRALTEGVVFLNRDGIVEEANDAVHLTYDHTIEELADPELDPRTRIIRPDGTPFPVEEQPAIVALRTVKTVRDVELGVPTRDGNISWRLVNAQPVLDDQGNLLGAVASFFDITERRMAEQALRESEERFRSLADSMPQLVWTALPDGRVDYYNKRYLEYQDIKQVKDQDWDWAPVLHPDDTQPTVEAWLHALETGEIYQIEHRVRMSDGSYRWHLSRGIPMLDEKRRVIRWFGTATDIHDLKLAEEQLKVYAGRLEQSNRELEQFAFMASHDLQEPLRKIEMFGDLLLERAKGLQENERNYLDRMRNAASRMRAMIEGLLQISRVATQGRPFVRVELSRVVSDVLSDFEEQILDSGARLEIDRLPSVTGDPLQLRQLMQNLIGNALKYRQPGSPPSVHIYANQLVDKVQICVKDKGIGFDQEDAGRIFEPFHRLVGRNEYAGSGIGLAICRRIVERHGGEIAAMSEPGQGTTFIVTLPSRPIKKSKK